MRNCAAWVNPEGPNRVNAVLARLFFFIFFYLSCHTHVHKRAERRARNIAGAEALAVARRPEVASREIFI